VTKTGTSRAGGSCSTWVATRYCCHTQRRPCFCTLARGPWPPPRDTVKRDEARPYIRTTPKNGWSTTTKCQQLQMQTNLKNSQVTHCVTRTGRETNNGSSHWVDFLRNLAIWLDLAKRAVRITNDNLLPLRAPRD